MQERTLYTDELYPFYKTDKVEGNTPTSEIMITLTDAEAIGLDLAMSMFESWQTMLKERYEVKMQSRAKEMAQKPQLWMFGTVPQDLPRRTND